MIWSYNDNKRAWELKDDASSVAVIYMTDMDNPVNRYVAKTALSSIYTGSKVFDRLTRKGKEWKTCRRKFRTPEERDAYVEIKKIEVKKYIESF